ncbi:F-box protein At5g39250 isoform X1 [Medicago truncatula]|uniref:F-box-like protein n=2 Tax=Medicago truncatula TaxID=3880 RepID=G7L589_MEDTR|nr:F-box protein At5g39250 isoform X1 [Medicago truncatula]AES77640.1 F-box-like protein [Medicago truncatula]
MGHQMESEEVLKAVFPLLEGVDLASCMAVCKQWNDIAKDDFFWKCMCANRWPSICKRPNPLTETYYKLYKTFHKRQQRRTLLPPRISFDDLEFFIDIWAEDILLFSEAVSGSVLQSGFRSPASGVCDLLKYHLESSEYKMTFPVEPRFTIPSGQNQNVSVSVMVGRKDTNKVACIINKSMFDYIERSSYRALAYDYLDISPGYPFLPGIRAWISLLFMEEGSEDLMDVFGIQMDFCDVANSKEEVLWLLDMLDWK